MTSRHLHEVEEADSPRREPITTPQFTSSQDFFKRRQDTALEDLLESPPRPVTFRPTDKHEYSLKPVVRVGPLNLDPESVTAIEELGLQVEDESLEPDDQLEPRLEIEKLRALAEEAIQQIKSKYSSLEADLMNRLTPDEQEMIHLTRPECLKDNPPLSARNAGLYGSADSFEEMRYAETRMAGEIKVLRDELDRLRKRLSESEGPSNRASMTGSLTGPTLLSILKSVQPQPDADKLERCTEVILDTVEKDKQSLEMQLRREIESRFEADRKAMKENFEEEIAKAVEETRIQANEYWQGRMKKGKTEDIEKIKENLYVEIEAKLQKEYEEKLKRRVSQMTGNRGKGEELSELREKLQQLEEYRANQEIEFELRLASEKEAWKEEITSIGLSDYRLELQRDFDRKLSLRTSEIQQDSKAEVAQLTQQFRREAQDAITQHLQRLNEETERKTESMKSVLREECMKELRSEREMRLSEAIAAKLTGQIDKDLRRELTPRVERELRSSLEQKLRLELQKEFEEVYEARKNQLEVEMKSRLRAAQERAEGRFEDDVNRLLQEKTAKIEKEMRIKYKSKLERQQKQLEAGLKLELSQKLEEEKAELMREKNEVARLKSALNVQIKKTSMDRKEEIDRIRRQEADLERKSKELSYQMTKMQIQEGISATPELKRQVHSTVSRGERSVTPLPRPRESRISPQKYTADSELISSLPRPLSPPQLSRQSPQSSERNNDKEQRLVPRYDSQDIVRALISKNLEEAQKEAVKTLQNTEKQSSSGVSYYPKEFEPTQTIKQPSVSELYYRSKDSEYRREEEPSRFPTARHQLYQELLKEHFTVLPTHKN